MDNLEENFYLIAPAAHEAEPVITGNLKIIDRHRKEFSFADGRTAVFTPYSEGAVMNEAGIPGELDEVAVRHPVQLLKELATFCGYEVIPRALSLAEQRSTRFSFTSATVSGLRLYPTFPIPKVGLQKNEYHSF